MTSHPRSRQCINSSTTPWWRSRSRYIRTRVEPLRERSERGASALETAIIAAVLIAAAVLIGGIVMTKVGQGADAGRAAADPRRRAVSRRPLAAAAGRRASDRGSTALEFAVLSVAFLLLVFLVVQAALYYHARNVIKAEAEGVARAVRAYPATATGPLRDQVPPPGPGAGAGPDRGDQTSGSILDNSGDTTSAPVAQAAVVGFDQVRVTVSAKPILHPARAVRRTS